MYNCKYCALVFVALWLAGCGSVRQAPAEINRRTARELQKGILQEDTSYIYRLPYKKGAKYLMVQGYYTRHSHQNMAAIDFKMKTGTTICAARSGVVVSVFDASNRGGLGNEYLADWNYIIIKHTDGSTAIYGHLKQHGALVKQNDTVQTGEPIGLSGNTGYSAFPHLHFQVWGSDGRQLPTRFYTRKGVRYLKPLKWYTAVYD